MNESARITEARVCDERTEGTAQIAPLSALAPFDQLQDAAGVLDRTPAKRVPTGSRAIPPFRNLKNQISVSVATLQKSIRGTFSRSLTGRPVLMGCTLLLSTYMCTTQVQADAVPGSSAAALDLADLILDPSLVGKKITVVEYVSCFDEKHCKLSRLKYRDVDLDIRNLQLDDARRVVIECYSHLCVERMVGVWDGNTLKLVSSKDYTPYCLPALASRPQNAASLRVAMTCQKPLTKDDEEQLAIDRTSREHQESRMRAVQAAEEDAFCRWYFDVY